MRPVHSLLALALVAALSSDPLAQCELQTFGAPAGSLGGFGSFLAQDGARFAVASDASVHLFEQVGRTAYHEQEIPLELDLGWIHSIALGGDWLAIGAHAHNEGDVVLMLIRERRAGTWVETQRLRGDAAWEGFGHAVALEGDRLYVGAPSHDSPGIANTGAVYVFALTSGVWSEAERLVPRVPRLNEQFGEALDVEGGRLAVGAPLAFSNRQSVYVFERSSDGWLETRLTPASAITARFGVTLDLRGDVLLVGDPSARFGGRAWVFERGAGGWAETAELFVPGSDVVFGVAEDVALSGDGALALIGSGYADDPLPDSGLVYVFEKRAGVWEQAETIYPISPFHQRGFGRALECDGDLALVGGGGLIATHSPRESLCKTLLSQPAEISLTTGGRHTLRLNPGRQHAGRRYLLLGSASGHDPGVSVGSSRIPLGPDWDFASSIPGPRRPPCVNNGGVLDAQTPQATVTIDVPPGLDRALVGLKLYHAFVVLDGGIVDVSNVRELTLVP